MDLDHPLKKLVNVGEFYSNEQLRMEFEILNLDGGPGIMCRYHRNGVTIEHHFTPEQLVPSITNPELFEKKPLDSSLKTKML